MEGRNTTIILLTSFAIFLALIDMSPSLIGPRPTAGWSVSTRKLVGICATSASTGGLRASGARCCRSFSDLSTPSYTRLWVWSQPELCSAGFRRWIDFYYLTRSLVRCNRASQPFQRRSGGSWSGSMCSI